MGINVPGALALYLGFVVVTGALQAQGPSTMSPGRHTEFALLEARCPTFSWGAVPGALQYEIAVYSLEGGEVEVRGDLPDATLEVVLGGTGTSWTPAVDQCLERDGRYLWVVRAILSEGRGAWSLPRFFRTSQIPSVEEVGRALETLRAFQRSQEAGESRESEQPSNGLEERRSDVLHPESSAVASGEAITVDGVPVVLRSELCGNGAVESWEECDPGIHLSGCTADCASFCPCWTAGELASNIDPAAGVTASCFDGGPGTGGAIAAWDNGSLDCDASLGEQCILGAGLIASPSTGVNGCSWSDLSNDVSSDPLNPSAQEKCADLLRSSSFWLTSCS